MKSLLTNCFNKADSVGKKSKEYSLPVALNKYNFDNGSYLSVQNAKIKIGWKLVPDWSPKYQIETREGFVHVPVLEATNPGAELSLSFTGTAVGMAIVSGPDAGIVEYSIDKRPFQQIDLYTQWSKHLYLPWYVLFSGNLKNKKHILRLRIAQEKNADSKGNACQVVHFLVNQ
jgi:sialidase-1